MALGWPIFLVAEDAAALVCADFALAGDGGRGGVGHGAPTREPAGEKE